VGRWSRTDGMEMTNSFFHPSFAATSVWSNSQNPVNGASMPRQPGGASHSRQQKKGQKSQQDYVRHLQGGPRMQIRPIPGERRERHRKKTIKGNRKDIGKAKTTSESKVPPQKVRSLLRRFQTIQKYTPKACNLAAKRDNLHLGVAFGR